MLSPARPAGLCFERKTGLMVVLYSRVGRFSCFSEIVVFDAGACRCIVIFLVSAVVHGDGGRDAFRGALLLV